MHTVVFVNRLGKFFGGVKILQRPFPLCADVASGFDNM